MRSPQNGLTLVELTVAIAVVSILAAIGLPSYRYVTTSNRISSEVNGLLLDLQYARSEALKQGRTVSICPATAAVPPACRGDSKWENGWIVFMDVNGNGLEDAPASEPVLKFQPSFAANKDTFVSDNGVTAITYNREGFAAGLTPAAGYITITLHDKTANKTWTRCLEVNTIGKVRVEHAGDVNGNCS
jgi:type IV fimbrial biogenesis protein FimT